MRVVRGLAGAVPILGQPVLGRKVVMDLRGLELRGRLSLNGVVRRWVCRLVRRLVGVRRSHVAPQGTQLHHLVAH